MKIGKETKFSVCAHIHTLNEEIQAAQKKKDFLFIPTSMYSYNSTYFVLCTSAEEEKKILLYTYWRMEECSRKAYVGLAWAHDWENI